VPEAKQRKKLKRKENSKVSKGRALQGAALGANVKHRANQSNTTGPEDLERGLVGRADVVEARRALATQTFTPEALGIKIGQKVHKVPTSEGMQTIFAAEANMDVQRKLLAARQPFPEDFTPAVPSFDVSSQAAAAGMPLRPKWHRGMVPAMLHFRESKAFQRWMGEVKEAYQDRGGHLPVFEMNLQVWRQLWRVLERADVATVVVDVRAPLIHLPPALYLHVCHRLSKPMVVVLSKADLVPASIVAQWADWLRQLPGVMQVVPVCSKSIPGNEERQITRASDAMSVVSTCHEVYREFGEQYPERVARRERAKLKQARKHEDARLRAKIAQDKKRVFEGQVASSLTDSKEGLIADQEKSELNAQAAASRLLIGLVGQPNVGKSSLLNALFAHNRVSVKETPGHTKILQTIVLDEKTALFDCPGVVFPRIDVSRESQVVAGLIPLAQVREPFSSVRWLASCCQPSLSEMLKLQPLKTVDPAVLEMPPDDPRFFEVEDGAPPPWSPLALCHVYAKMRGLSRKTQTDDMQAGTEILRKNLEGKIRWWTEPPPSRPSLAEWEGAYGEDNEEDDEHGGWLDISDDDFHDGEEGDEEGVENPEQYSKDYQEDDDFFNDAALFSGMAKPTNRLFDEKRCITDSSAI